MRFDLGQLIVITGGGGGWIYLYYLQVIIQLCLRLVNNRITENTL